MRRARIKADGGYYHCMSRIIEGRWVLGDAEKERFRKIMRRLEGFCCLQILTYSIMSNHFHILLDVPVRRELSDDEFLYRLKFLYDDCMVATLALQLKEYRDRGEDVCADGLKSQYTYRMFDVSEFFKTLKQSFSQYYNRREGRRGPLWEQRFKSILVEGSEHALGTMAAYVDLNAIRAGIVEDPKDYRYCGYGEAMGGGKAARHGIMRLAAASGSDDRWAAASFAYRKHIYVQGEARGLDPEGRPLRTGFTEAQVQEVIDHGGRLPLHAAIRCRVRYFSDGLVLGSREFVEQVFVRNRDQFGSTRNTGARTMRSGQWGQLHTLRALRLHPVSLS